MTQEQNVARLLKTIYHAVETSLDNHLFEFNDSLSESEFAIQNVAMSFDAPNFIAVTVCGQKYIRENKRDFIEDMRMHFADNPNFVIDGMFEYYIDPPSLPTFTLPARFADKTFFDVMNSL